MDKGAFINLNIFIFLTVAIIIFLVLIYSYARKLRSISKYNSEVKLICHVNILYLSYLYFIDDILVIDGDFGKYFVNMKKIKIKYYIFFVSISDENKCFYIFPNSIKLFNNFLKINFPSLFYKIHNN